MVGGGIGSLAAAAFMIRDGVVSGKNITIYEAAPVLGGSLDGGGNAENGYSMRGGRMLTTDNYECTWALFQSIPSLEHPGKSVYDETIEFNARMHSHSQARLIDRNPHIVDVASMGFTMADRTELLKLSEASEEKLGISPITDWLSPEFFTTTFWQIWSTTFAFQPWHSAVEFKRYLHRFMKEFSRIETLAGVTTQHHHGMPELGAELGYVDGAAMALGRDDPMWGALLLFVTNVVLIIAAGTLTLWVQRWSHKRRAGRRAHHDNSAPSPSLQPAQPMEEG